MTRGQILMTMNDAADCVEGGFVYNVPFETFFETFLFNSKLSALVLYLMSYRWYIFVNYPGTVEQVSRSSSTTYHTSHVTPPPVHPMASGQPKQLLHKCRPY